MKYYHGTSDVFKMRTIEPPIITDVLREDWRNKLINKVFFTTSKMSAYKFAKKAAEKYGGNPVVYEVTPVGDIWHVNTNEYVADKAIIKCIAE